MVEFLNPLDITNILNLVAGSFDILTFILFILIGMLAGRFRMPNVVLLIMLVLFPVIVGGAFPNLYFLVICFMGFFASYMIIRFFNAK